MIMATGEMEMRFSENQLLGAIKIKPYRDCIAGLSDFKRDIARVKAWERDVAAADRPDDLTSPVLAFVRDAEDFILASAAYFTQNEVDTTNLDVWLTLRDMVCCATRLSTLPGFVVEEYGNATVRQLVMATAELMDIVFRLTDPATLRSAPPVADEKVMQARYASIYLDLVCGRSPLWISYIDALGTQLAIMLGETWTDKYNAYAVQRMLLACTKLMQRMQCDQDSAVTAVGGAALACGYMFDARQQQVHEADCRFTVRIEESMRETYMREGADEAFGKVDEPLEATGSDTYGYCSIASVPPMAAVMMLPQSYSKRFRSQYLDMVNDAAKVFGGDA